MAVWLDEVGAHELHLDLARMPGVVGSHRVEIAERALGALLDQLTGPLRRDVPGAVASEALLHRDGRQALAEKLAAFLANGMVAGDEEHGQPKVPQSAALIPVSPTGVPLNRSS